MKMKKRRVRDFLLAGSLILGMMLTGCGMSGQQTEQNGGKEQNKVENEKEIDKLTKMSEADEIIRKLNTEQRDYLNRYFAHAPEERL